jgi:hypothetical protein
VDLRARVVEYGRWAESLRSRCALVAAGRIEGTVDASVGEPVLSAVNGYFLVRASGDAEAASIAQECPHVAHGGRVTALRTK